MISLTKIAVFFIILNLCTIVLDCQSIAENKYGIEKATAKGDELAVYSRMSVKSKKMTDINEGEKVIVNFEMFGPGSDGPWCAIKTEGEKAVSGYVQCVHLERDAFPKQEWQRVDSPGSDSTSQETEAIIIQDINNVLSEQNISKITALIKKLIAFHKVHTNIPNPLIVKIRIFKLESDFKEYQKNISTTSTTNTAFYSISKNELVINKEKKEYVKSIIHEAQHMILRLNGFSKPPKWLNEGLSEFFEEMYIDTMGRTFAKEQSWRRKRLQKWLEEKSLPELSEFLVWSSDDWEKKDEEIEYMCQTISWGLSYFLMGTPKGRVALIETIKELKMKRDSNPGMILNNHYNNGGISTLERDYYTFIAKIPREEEFL